ncbi:T49 [Tupaiid betaherpesvirus 1]|uniref:T49 n=1 Tax=Tupaiid herpesvirus 1 (strain 1) TaxID=10397 RepID=Q91TN9_TUHV1|nr:T49 [Tupaiid betaherpesvirus 1]AAK57098.1 T49 [Tupaiid betaherpesvirus 1]
MSWALRRLVRELIGPLCRHHGHHHLEVLLTGVPVDADGRRGAGGDDRGGGGGGGGDGGEDGGGDGEDGDGGGDEEERERREESGEPFCVLDMFVTIRRVVSREQTDRFYERFARRWLERARRGDDRVRAHCERLAVTKTFLVFLAYVYLLHCIAEAARRVRLPGLREVCWTRVEERLARYPREKLENFLDGVTLQQLNELHRHVLGLEFRVPFVNHTSSPCLALLRSRDYEDVETPRYQNAGWIRRRERRREDAATRGLRAALRRRAGLAPCGNPLYVMCKVLVEHFCRTEARYLIPLRRRWVLDGGAGGGGGAGSGGGPGAGAGSGGSGGGAHHGAHPATGGTRGGGPPARAEGRPAKIVLFALSVALRHGLIGSVIELPVACHCKTKCERYRGAADLVAVVCRNCGHCLNLGKEKLLCAQTFPLNSLFYYRDRQEKSVIYSTHHDLAHCSLCGSQYLESRRIYEVQRFGVGGFRANRVCWRAVTGSNSACAVYDGVKPFDAIVPCSSRTCFSTVILRQLSVAKLLRLVSHGSDFFCQLCQNVYRETCADQEGGSPCVGCDVFRRFRCRCFRTDRGGGGGGDGDERR